MPPAISIVLASSGDREPNWDRVRDCLRSIAEQNRPGIEVVLCKPPELQGEIPQDLEDRVPVHVVAPEIADDNSRKTAGAQATTAPVVAFLDLDCMLQAGWIHAVLDVFEFYPEVAVLRGRMRDEKLSWTEALRSWWRGPGPGPARSTAVSNVAFRREAYLEYPFRAGSAADAVRIQTEAMRRARYVLWEEPAMLALRDRRGLAQAAGVALKQPAALAR